jgi:tRNA pseudouridine38-40 synthase
MILNRPVRSALYQKRATWHHYPLDAERMHCAGQCLLGEQDFSSFRAKDCQSKTPFRNVHCLSVKRDGDWICLDIEANAFLHHMVRNIAGVLIAIGQGERPVEWAAELLQIRDRAQGGVTARPDGLYLQAVRYEPHWGLPDPDQNLSFDRSMD